MEKQNLFVGSYRKLRWGYTSDKNIRDKASGGGIVSDILISALRKKLIDGAIVTKMNPESLRAEAFVAKTKDDILNAAGSKYVIASNLKVIQTLKKGRYAFVGLPCQIQALRKMQAKNDWRAKQIVYTIGLFCGSSMDNEVIDYLMKKLKVKGKISDIQFRSRNNADASSLGGFLVKSGNTEKYLDKEAYGFLRHLFMNEACKFCFDQTNELADISVGDLWLKRKYGEKLPSSVIIRTKKGNELIENSKTLNLCALSADDLINCEFDLLLDKKIRTLIRMNKSVKLTNIMTYDNKILSTENKCLWGFLFFEKIWLKILNLRKTKFGRFLIYNLPFGFWKNIITVLYKIHYLYLRKILLAARTAKN